MPTEGRRKRGESHLARGLAGLAKEMTVQRSQILAMIMTRTLVVRTQLHIDMVRFESLI